MSEIIASTYEIIKKIGSGGAGIVYRGRHLRLGKDVVLKADRRTISAKPEVLRREVDSLKNLSHTYIPQVYDFIVDSETVYTVMDFIEGESLDKPLKRGELFPQRKVIEWSCQLLDALRYLHSRPPYGILHGDIKPANIMLTPQGDIRLIDFNIALALGEEGTARVGYSRGYASPEHYGIDYSSRKRYSARSTTEEETELLDSSSASSQSLPPSLTGSGPTGSGKRTILLDVRSDIYSLGATLYHLLTGKRPPEDAKAVIPIHVPSVSPAVSAIIQKAMAPNPDQRYQTAQEMLDAFTHLHENDPRTIRHKRQVRIVSALLAAIFLAGGICTFIGLRQMERAQAEAAEEAKLAAEEARLAEEAERSAKQALAAVTASEIAYQQGNIQAAIDSAIEALSLDSPYAAQAQKALTDALGIYDLSDGFKLHSLIELSSEPLKIALSPAGTRTAVMTLGETLIFDTETGRQLVTLAAVPSALADLVFLNEDVIIYAGQDGLQSYEITREEELWHGGTATGIALSADNSTVAAVYRNDNQATIYDTASGAVRRVVSFETRQMPVSTNDIYIDPEDGLFTLDRTGEHLAVSFSDGSLWCYDLTDPEGDFSLYTDGSEFNHFEGGFCGDYLAFSADSGSRSVFAAIDVPNLQQVGGFSMNSRFHVQADESGIFFAVEDIMVELDTATWEQRELGYTGKDLEMFTAAGNYTAAVSDDVLYLFGGNAQLVDSFEGLQPRRICLAGDYAILANEDSPVVQVLKLENHPEAQMLSYDPTYAHSEARVSADGKTVMLFHSRGFRLYSMDGSILAEVEIPDAGEVYDCQYLRDVDGSRLEIIYNSGLIRTYSAVDGGLLSEIRGKAPSGDAYDEYLLDHLRITSPLHGAPAAYDRETGELVKELNSEDYMTYATQVGKCAIVEFINMDQERYGLLLDENCETLATLPNLCDILEEDTLVFDDKMGNLRQCRIYSIQELIALAKQS